MTKIKKKSVLFVCSYNNISGGLIMIFEHAYRLQLSGYDTYITFRFTDQKKDYSAFPHSSELNIIDYGTQTEFDIVLATFWSTVYLLTDFKAYHYAYFVQCDERLFYDKDDLNACWAELTYSIPGVVPITSAQCLTRLLTTEFGTPSFHAPCGIDLSLFKPVKKGTHSKVRVLIEGPGKARIKRIDDAFKVTKSVSGIEIWYVTSDGYVAPEWKPDQVFKKVPYHQMPDVYQSCDILLKMSGVESFGLPNLEMMACGGAVITTDFTGHEEYAVDGENSFVVKIGDVETASVRLQQLVDNADLREKFGENGVKTAQSRDWNTLRPDFSMALENLESHYPQGSAQLAFPKLKALSKAFQERELLLNKLQYLENWKQNLVKREKHLYYRISNKLHKLLGNT